MRRILFRLIVKILSIPGQFIVAHMDIEGKGAANGILDAREHFRYIHLSESDCAHQVPGLAIGTKFLQPLQRLDSKEG